MVYVTHDQVEAMTLADRIVVMNKGCIEQVGRPLDLYYAPANLFVAGFIGSPAMNFFEAKVGSVEGGCARVNGLGFRSFDLPANSLKVGDALTVGVRPEHLVRGADGRMFMVEIRGRQTPAPGEAVSIVAATSDVHVFDASGLRVATQTD